MREFYINAQTGEIIKNDQIIFNTVQYVSTKYNGTRSFQTTWRGSHGYFYLLDLSKPTPIETRNSAIRINFPYCRPWGFGNLDVVDNGTSSFWAYDAYHNAASAHWAVQESYNVFKNHFSRTYGTFKNSGGEIRVENNYYYRMDLGDNYLWYSTYYQPDVSKDYIHAGNIYGSEGYDVGLDVLGHEFTHGCLYRSRSITIQSGCEAGALMESLCDIFGEVIEYYTLGSNDYIFGTNDKPHYRRNYANPETDSVFSMPIYSNTCSPIIIQEYFYGFRPSIWQGTYWDTSDDQNYINCSVQNRWFYLLANGGTQNGVTVTGIGIEEAAVISYRNLAYYFTNSYTFANMRNASISNANYLYGECSNEAIQVTNAWAAVGVGAPAPDPCILPLYGVISGPSNSYCGNCETWYVYAEGGNGNYSYTWFIDGQIETYGEYMNYCFSPYATGRYFIDVTITDGEQSFTTGLNVWVDCFNMGGAQTAYSLSLFPNPASSSATLEITENEHFSLILKNDEYLVFLVDNNGRVLLNMNTKSRKLEIKTPNLPSGTYSVIVKVGNYRSSSTLIVEH